MRLRIFLTATSMLFASIITQHMAVEEGITPYRQSVQTMDRVCYPAEYIDDDGNVQCCVIKCEDQ